jgi:SAM-dependent methyltransferase
MTTEQERDAEKRPATIPPEYLDARTEFARAYLAGEGLEVGGLNWPLETPPWAIVRQVDRMSTEDLRKEYPEVADQPLLNVDIVDNGETLDTIPAGSQDFIIANHFLEHTQDPIGTIGIHLEKLKPGGVLFYAVPDKRYTFDFRRAITPLEHMIRDHEQGPADSRREHFDEWTSLVGGTEEDRATEDAFRKFQTWAGTEARRLEDEDFSIHMHVWDQASFLALLLHCRKRFGNFDIEVTAQRSIEIVTVLRKSGTWPAPHALSQRAPEPSSQTVTEQRADPEHRRVGFAGQIRSALRRRDRSGQ